MDSIRDLMMDRLHGITPRETTTPLYSTVTGKRESGSHLTADYWHRSARQPVLFTDALTHMLRDGFDTFIEIDPHPVLVARDAPRLRRVAHMLKGTLDCFAAREAVATALRLEHLGQEANLIGADEAYGELDANVERVKRALGAYAH